ncbi:MAG: hypothetical protein H6510_00010 [Acidobacteria bacterium]|nr:hypothetical protein [Acidobacteriota bacterium]
MALKPNMVISGRKITFKQFKKGRFPAFGLCGNNQSQTEKTKKPSNAKRTDLKSGASKHDGKSIKNPSQTLLLRRPEWRINQATAKIRAQYLDNSQGSDNMDMRHKTSAPRT